MSNVFTKTLTAIVVTLVSFGFAVMPAAAAFSASEKAALAAAGFDAATIAALELVLGGGSSSTTTTGGSTVTSSQPTGYFHSTTLVLGSRGAQVSALQAALNSCYSAGLSVDGAYGPATKAAVMNAQAKLGVSVDGIVGPVTGSMLGTCTVTTTVPGTTTTTTGGGSFVLAGGDEAALEDFDMDDGPDDSLNAGDTAVVAEIEFDVEDSDVLLERLDVVFRQVDEADATGEDTDPWKVFKSATLIVNGEEVAEFDASDDDEWSEANYITGVVGGFDFDSNAGNNSSDEEFRMRFSGLSEVLEEGETALIEIEVTINSSIDIDTGDNQAEWAIAIPADGIRTVDEAGLTQETPAVAAAEGFTIKREGTDNEIDVSSASNDPDSRVIEVKKNNTSDWHTVGIFEIEADDDGQDVSIDNFQIAMFITDPNGGVDLGVGASEWNKVIDDVRVTAGGITEKKTNSVTAVTQFTAATTEETGEFEFNFDFDNDLEIDAGDTEEVKVEVKFKQLPAAGNVYDAGTKVWVSVDQANLDDWDVENGETLSSGQKTGSYTGEQHELRTEGISLAFDSSSSTSTTVDGDDNDKADFTLKFKVTAFESDQYIPKNIPAFGTTMTTGANSTSGVAPTAGASRGVYVHMQNTGAGTLIAGNFSATLSSTAQEMSNSYRIEKGDTETFTVKVFAVNDATGQLANSNVRMLLEGVAFADSNTATSTDVYTFNLIDDYKTDYENIAN